MNFVSFSTHRNAIYGMAALWIVLFHGFGMQKIFLPPEFKFITDTMNMGNIAVDIFVLLSGVGLYFSFSKGPSIGEFYYKRFVRVYIPYLIMVLPYAIYYLSVGEMDVGLFIQVLLTVNFWTGMSDPIDLWYISVILVFYLIYPLIYKFIFRENKNCRLTQEKAETLRTVLLALLTFIIAVVVCYCLNDVYSVLSRALSRLTVFVVGCYFGKLVKNKRRFSVWVLVAAVAIVAGAYPLYAGDLLDSVWWRYYGSLTGVALVFIWSQIFVLLSYIKVDKVFAFLGSISLEIYIIAIIARKIYYYTDWYGEYALPYYLLVSLIAIAVAYIVSLIEKPIIKLLMRPMKSKKR